MITRHASNVTFQSSLSSSFFSARPFPSVPAPPPLPGIVRLDESLWEAYRRLSDLAGGHVLLKSRRGSCAASPALDSDVYFKRRSALLQIKAEAFEAERGKEETRGALQKTTAEPIRRRRGQGPRR